MDKHRLFCFVYVHHETRGLGLGLEEGGKTEKGTIVRLGVEREASEVK